MNQRLQQFLAAENISQAQFADSIDVARASVSHVLAGRNKPGYDFIRSISDHYPKLNLEWLISGKGKMYKQDSPAVAPQPAPEPAAEAQEASFNGELFGPETDSETAQQPENEEVVAPVTASQKPEPSPFRRSITRIIVFYDDNTYQELK
jgi:transcriptional regulator with XRE-family HTH domain